MTKRCLVIFNQPAPDALPDELDVLAEVRFIDKTLRALGYEVEQRGLTSDIFSETARIAGEGFDFVFNLVESVMQKAEILYFMPALLNMHSIPYTGCPVEAAFITASKVLARNTMKANGITVARGFKVSEAHLLMPGRRYILKPIWEDASIGITEESVFTFDGTSPEILNGKSDRHWFIEEFIEGREFNVSLVAGAAGPEMLPPAEILFHDYPEHLPRIVSYKAKWEEESFQYENSRRHFPTDLSNRLMDNIRNTVHTCWNIFGLKGYARVDMRVDTSEKIYVLEVNANPCISPDGGFIAAAEHAGYSHQEIIGRIINDLNT